MCRDDIRILYILFCTFLTLNPFDVTAGFHLSRILQLRIHYDEFVFDDISADRLFQLIFKMVWHFETIIYHSPVQRHLRGAGCVASLGLDIGFVRTYPHCSDHLSQSYGRKWKIELRTHQFLWGIERRVKARRRQVALNFAFFRKKINHSTDMRQHAPDFSEPTMPSRVVHSMGMSSNAFSIRMTN